MENRTLNVLLDHCIGETVILSKAQEYHFPFRKYLHTRHIQSSFSGRFISVVGRAIPESSASLNSQKHVDGTNSKTFNMTQLIAAHSM
ncbi:hypothetical protein ACTXT7_003287 [Hymenolepis weldensis]